MSICIANCPSGTCTSLASTKSIGIEVSQQLPINLRLNHESYSLYYDEKNQLPLPPHILAQIFQAWLRVLASGQSLGPAVKVRARTLLAWGIGVQHRQDTRIRPGPFSTRTLRARAYSGWSGTALPSLVLDTLRKTEYGRTTRDDTGKAWER
jgi:hypothetical protein